MKRLTIEQAETRCPSMVKNQEWVNTLSKYWFLCERHGRYLQEYNSHRYRSGCPKCGTQKAHAACHLTIEEMEQTCPDLEKGQKARGVNAKYWFKCEQHGRYEQEYNSHRQGHFCSKCSGNRFHTIEEMERTCPDLEKGQKARGVEAKYLFTCETHGRYRQRYNSHRRGQGCPICCGSKGEKALAEAARILGMVDYEKQKRFFDCRNSKPLPFDGASESIRTLFEYHGEQHYRSNLFFGGLEVFEKAQHRDRIKRNWARRNDWRLIVVPYRIKNIESYLRKRIPTGAEELPVAA